MKRRDGKVMPEYDDNYDDFEDMEMYVRKQKAFHEEYWLKTRGEEDGFAKSLSDAIIPTIDFSRMAATLSRQTESPIETIFLMDLKICLREMNQPFLICRQDQKLRFDENSHLLIIPQFWWKFWRFDFAFKWPLKAMPSVIVECDGKQFHSSPEQIAKDRAKDEEAKRLNIQLLRFTGSEIHESARACVLATLNEVART